SVNRRESQPSPLAYRLGSKKRLEDVGQGLGFDADPCVANRQLNVPAWLHLNLRLNLGLLQLNVVRLQREPATIGHCVARIQSQIHYDLLDLTRIRLDPSQIFPLHNGELDSLSQQPWQQLSHIAQNCIQIQDSKRDDLLAAECQQLTGQAGSFVGSLLDLFHSPSTRIRLMQAFQ